MDGVEAVFVDLSNVAKDPLLGFSADHAALSRWDRLRAVWLRDHALESAHRERGEASEARRG